MEVLEVMSPVVKSTGGIASDICVGGGGGLCLSLNERRRYYSGS